MQAMISVDVNLCDIIEWKLNADWGEVEVDNALVLAKTNSQVTAGTVQKGVWRH